MQWTTDTEESIGVWVWPTSRGEEVVDLNGKQAGPGHFWAQKSLQNLGQTVSAGRALRI
jgi:hypothetical protein